MLQHKGVRTGVVLQDRAEKGRLDIENYIPKSYTKKLAGIGTARAVQRLLRYLVNEKANYKTCNIEPFL